jgi:putative ABC transport system ATP-binding protein
VLQGHGLIPVLTAAENVEVVLQALGRPAAEVREAAAAALDRVLLGEVADRLVERLSGGQQQRVAVARALVHQPDLLIADEPTSELDEETRDRVVGELRREADRGAVVLIATHDPDIVAACDRALRLVSGRIEAGRHRSTAQETHRSDTRHS